MRNMFKNKICVLTPTIRLEGLKIVQKALEEQDFDDFDWYIGSPKEPKTWGTWIQDDFKGGVWSLNRIYNKLIMESNGELIVSWQDFTYGDKNILSTLWEHYQKDKKSLVSVLGNKYYDETFELASWIDPRFTNVLTRETQFQDVEWNLCSCPRESLYEIGGFDSAMDMKFFGMDGFNVNQRLNDLGYRFFVDGSVRSYSLMHGRVPDWDEKNGINGLYQQHVESRKKEGKWPILDYLPR